MSTTTRTKFEYYCSCSKGKMKYETQNKHTKMHVTTVTGDETCVHCEHYALASSYRPKYNGTPFDVDNALLLAKKDSDRWYQNKKEWA